MGDAQPPAQQQGKSDLDFYIRFARPLIFNLPDAQDRVLASAWVKKIKNPETGGEKLRTDYIKLLLFALQRQKLVGIFSDDPTGYEKLEEFPDEYDLNEMAKLLLQKEKSERMQRIRRQLRGQTGDYPPYSTDLSPDLREYVAAQDIPGFGVHCYYAISKDPVNTWLKADKGVFPKMAKSAVDTSGPTPPGMTLSDSCICKPGEDPEQPLGECKAMKEQQPPPKKKKSKKLGKSPPTSPLGKMPEPDDRAPPLWGSNLLEVRDVDNSDVLPEPESPPELRDREEEAAMMREMGFAVADYMSGEIIKRGHKTKRKKKPQEPEQEAEGEGEGKGELEGEAEEEESADAAKRREEIMQDAKLLEYFKGKLEKAQHKQKLSKFGEKVGAAVPATSGIPVTTPKPSTLPQRIPNSERLYSSAPPGAAALPPGEHLPPPPAPKPVPAGKDVPMFRMYENLQNAIEADEQLKMILERAAQQRALLDMDDDVEEVPQDEINEEPPPEPIKPIQRGSPEAAGIIGEFMDSMTEQQPPPKPPTCPPPPPPKDDAKGSPKKKKQKKGLPTYQPSGSPGVDAQMQRILDKAAEQQAILDQTKFGSPDRQAFSRLADTGQGQGIMDESYNFPASPPCPLTCPSPQGGRMGPPMGTPPPSPGAWLGAEQPPDFPPSPPRSPPMPMLPRVAPGQGKLRGLMGDAQFGAEHALYKMKLGNALRKPLPPKGDLSPTEQKYIDYTFARDPQTRNLVTRVCKMITDVPQEVPDPPIPPPSPGSQLPAVGDVPRIMDESFDFPASPPCSPQQTPQRPPGGMPGPGREAKPFPTPSTGAIPKRGMVPPPSRIPGPPSRIPGPGGRRPSVQRPPPTPESPLYPRTTGPPQTGPLPPLYGPPQPAPCPPPCPGPPSVGGTPQSPGGYTPPRPSPRGPPSVGGTPQSPGGYTPPPPPFTISPVQFTPPLDSISPPDFYSPSVDEQMKRLMEKVAQQRAILDQATPVSAGPMRPQAQAPCQQAYYETPTRAAPQGQAARRTEPYRFREGAQNVRRRLSDVFAQEPVPAPEMFSDQVLARHPGLLPPPSPGMGPGDSCVPTCSNRGSNIMDRPIDADLRSPMRPTAVVPGWQTPENLRRPSGQNQQQWAMPPQPMAGGPPCAQLFQESPPPDLYGGFGSPDGMDNRWDQVASMPGAYLDDVTPPLLDDNMCTPECPGESGYPGYSQPPTPPTFSPYQSPPSPRTPPNTMQMFPPTTPGGPSDFMTPSPQTPTGRQPCPALSRVRIETPPPSPDYDMQVANMMNRLQDAPGAEAIQRRRLVQPKKRRTSYQQPVLTPVTEMSPGSQQGTPCPSRGGSPQSPLLAYNTGLMLESPPFMMSPTGQLMNESPPPNMMSPDQFSPPGGMIRGGDSPPEFGDSPPPGGRKIIPRDATGRPYLDADNCQPCTPQELAAARQQMQQMQQAQQQPQMQQMGGPQGSQSRGGRPACGARSRQGSPSRQAEPQQPLPPERVAHQNASQVRLVTVMPPKQPDPQGACPDTC